IVITKQYLQLILNEYFTKPLYIIASHNNFCANDLNEYHNSENLCSDSLSLYIL
ncbi:hypothetical protein EVA_00508, partial [gut metagenome]